MDGEIADATHLPGLLRFPRPDHLTPGPAFLATAYEDKWDLFFHDHALIAARSWTGAPVLRAAIALDGDALLFDGLDVAPGWDPDLAWRHLDFLVWALLFGRPVPHPVPVGALADPEAAALWSFGVHGRHGWFATEVPFSDRLRLEEA